MIGTQYDKIMINYACMSMCAAGHNIENFGKVSVYVSLHGSQTESSTAGRILSTWLVEGAFQEVSKMLI